MKKRIYCKEIKKKKDFEKIFFHNFFHNTDYKKYLAEIN